MAALLSISDIIEIGDVSVYLSSNDNSRGALFGKRLSSPYSTIEIAAFTDALRWGYEGDSTDDTLRETANYCLWCYGMYGQQAQYIISGSGGGSVVPATSTRPQRLDFIVSSTSVIPTGGTGLTISNFIGWNLMFSRGGIEQSTVDVGDGSSWFSWDRDTGTFGCTPAAAATEQFILTPV